jgi:hypothetical protein
VNNHLTKSGQYTCSTEPVQLKTDSPTGCNSGKWKEVQAKILKEPFVLVKQTIPQQRALDLNFNLAP